MKDYVNEYMIIPGLRVDFPTFQKIKKEKNQSKGYCDWSNGITFTQRSW